jgi:hypothetical protein
MSDTAPHPHAVDQARAQDPPSSRTSNALECSLAFLSTWSGQPRVAGSLRFDPTDALSMLRGDPTGRERAEAYVGRPFEYVGPDASAYEVIAQRLSAGGPGSAAVIVNGWPPHLGSGTHAWNAYNHQGNIGWCDTTIGVAEGAPLYLEPFAVWAIFVDANWRPRS